MLISFQNTLNPFMFTSLSLWRRAGPTPYTCTSNYLQ